MKLAKRFEKKIPIGGNTQQEFWLKCLELFDSDYSKTYRNIFDKAAEIIPGYKAWFLEEDILAGMPECGSLPQNIPLSIATPIAYAEKMVEGEWEMRRFYQSNSGNSLISMWGDGSGDLRYRMELYEGSTFLYAEDGQNNLEPVERLFA